MPQENQILRCYSCLAFQVHLVKKKKKWQCKMCNSKQSVKKVYGKGSGKDCRLHVMKLKELQFSRQPTNVLDVKDENEPKVQDCRTRTETFTMNDVKNESKWSQYMNKVDDISEDEKEMNYRVMENECCNNKKRKLNKGFHYSDSEMSFELTDKLECQSNVGTLTENNEKREDEFKKYGITFYDNCSLDSGSKWSAFIEREQCLSDEECKSETEAIFMNKIDSCQNRSEASPDQERLNKEKLAERDRETCPVYNKYLKNTHFEENSILAGNGKENTGILKILESLHDNDDLDEILYI